MPGGDVTAEVGIVAPIDDAVEPLEMGGLTGPALVIPDPGAPADVVVIDEFGDPGEDVLLLDVDVLELIDVGRGAAGELCVNSSAIPLLPSTDPVWMLEIRLHGMDVGLFGAGA